MAMILQLAENPQAKIITNEILDLAKEIDKVLQVTRFIWAILYLDNPVASYSRVSRPPCGEINIRDLKKIG
jgi:hypothetical protein